MSEAAIHFEFYRHLQNAIESTPNRGNRTYDTVTPEYGQDISGFADLVLFDIAGDPVLIIEAKRPTDGEPNRDIDPYAPRVIRQAFQYAAELGAPYFATFNGDRLVLFNTFEEGVPLLERSTKSYDIGGLKQFADSLLDELARLEQGVAKWDSLDNAFIERIKSIHEVISPELEAALQTQLDSDNEFATSFSNWANAQGIEYGDMDPDEQEAVHHRFAEEAAYLLINKILFYKLLESAPSYADDIDPLAVSIHRVRGDLQDHFESLVDAVDFEAIFEHDPIYSEIPLDQVGERIRDFILELDDQDLSQFDSDVIGRIYEGVIPPERRHDMGEYYTPPAITELITRLTIEDANDTILDPACGSGGFLVSAYHRKRSLLSEPQGSHAQLLDQIYGVDINRFPAHLSAINLAIQDLSAYTENVQIEVSDFFDVEPDTIRFAREQASPSGSEQEAGMITDSMGGFDTVVGNPPYIRYQNIGDSDKVRSHLSQVDAEYLSGFSDIYCYFLTHSTQFLTEGGRLGFIVSDRWLDTQYGEDLQQFLLDNYKIKSVLRFDRQAFDDALVDSSIIVIEKCANPEERENTIANFVQVRENVSVDEIESIVEQDTSTDELVVDDHYRLLANTQEGLRDIKKWNLLYSAPPIYFDIIRSKGMTELQEVADLHTGKKVGGNTYFYRRKEEWQELGLQEYTSPAIKASGQVHKIRFDEEAAEEWEVLDLLDLVREALDDNHSFGDSKEKHVKTWLDEHENDHDALLEYIEMGEEQDHHTHDRCERRDVWFCIDDAEDYRPPFVIPQFLWTVNRVLLNEAEAFVDWQFHTLEPHSGIDNMELCGILNSRVAWLNRELEGRRAGGQGMTRSELRLYEAQQLSIPDPRKMTEEEKEQIKVALDALLEKEEEIDADADLSETEKERDDLDHAVLTTIGFEDRLDELKDAVHRLLASRERGAGEATEVMVERESDERKVIELKGVSEARESATLGDYS